MIYYFISNYGFIDSEVYEGQIDPPKFAFRTKVAAESYFDLITPKELREIFFYEYGDEDNIRAARVTGHPDIVFEVTVNLEDRQTYFLGTLKPTEKELSLKVLMNRVLSISSQKFK